MHSFMPVIHSVIHSFFSCARKGWRHCFHWCWQLSRRDASGRTPICWAAASSLTQHARSRCLFASNTVQRPRAWILPQVCWKYHRRIWNCTPGEPIPCVSRDECEDWRACTTARYSRRSSAWNFYFLAKEFAQREHTNETLARDARRVADTPATGCSPNQLWVWCGQSLPRVPAAFAWFGSCHQRWPPEEVSNLLKRLLRAHQYLLMYLLRYEKGKHEKQKLMSQSIKNIWATGAVINNTSFFCASCTVNVHCADYHKTPTARFSFS